MKPITDTEVKKLADKLMVAFPAMTHDHAIFVALAMQHAAESEQFQRNYGTFGLAMLDQANALIQSRESE